MSPVMWANVVQYVPENKISVADLHAASRTSRDTQRGTR